jgi:5-methylcytosine-specific restriction endonuclease McrA
MTHSCLGCGRLIDIGERCRDCRLPKASIEDRAGHDRLRTVVLAEEKVCSICGLPGTPEDPLTLEHVVPRSRGGRHTRHNGRAAHRSCNSAKRDRDPKPSGIRVIS